jgi:hypothetical protein
MVKQLFIILISLQTVAQVNTATFAYLGKAEDSRFFVFERVNDTIKSAGVLRFNYDQKSFSYCLDSHVVNIKGIFYNNWYLVKTVDKTYIEIYIDSLLKKTILLSKDKVIELENSKWFFEKFLNVIVIKNSAKLYVSPNEKSVFHEDSLKFKCFRVLKIKGEWLKVSRGGVSDMCWPKYRTGEIKKGWIKWIDKNEILIKEFY